MKPTMLPVTGGPKSALPASAGNCTLCRGGTVRADGSTSGAQVPVDVCQCADNTPAIGWKPITSKGAVKGNALRTRRLNASSLFILVDLVREAALSMPAGQKSKLSYMTGEFVEIT